MSRGFWVHILTNVPRTVMYVGMTSDLERRVAEHLSGEVKGFTQRYHLHTLVHVEMFDRVDDAIAREKQIKGWRRAKKNALVERHNPSWADLSEGHFGKDPSLRSG
jgi:predicted GIY-YIG superfamily endonuclease